MRYRLAFAVLLPLAGCAVPAEPVGYGYAAGYPGPYPSDYAYPAYPPYGDFGGPPVTFYEGGWGWWDHDHRWHHAEGMEHPGGPGFHSWPGGPPGHVAGVPPGAGPGGFHPPGPPPGTGFAGHPGGPPPGAAFHPPAPAPGFHGSPGVAVARGMAGLPPPHRPDDHH